MSDDDVENLKTAIYSLQKMGELLGHGFFFRACLAYSIGAMIEIEESNEDFDETIRMMRIAFERMKLEKNKPLQHIQEAVKN